MDFNSLIGLEVIEAKKLLIENNYNNISVIINAKEDVKCNTTLVCAVKPSEDGITLICGTFYLLDN